MTEKLSTFRKAVGGLGKRLAFRVMKKTSFLLITDLCNVVIDKYTELYGSRSVGIKKFAEILRKEAIDVTSDIVETPILFGISMRSFLSKDLRDISFIIEMVFYTVLGEKWSYFMGKPEYIPAELTWNKNPQWILRVLHCPFCYNITKMREDASKLEPGVTHGTWFAKLLEGIMQGMIDYTGLDYRVECVETQCFLNGHKNGEMVYTLYPKEK